MKKAQKLMAIDDVDGTTESALRYLRSARATRIMPTDLEIMILVRCDDREKSVSEAIEKLREYLGKPMPKWGEGDIL